MTKEQKADIDRALTFGAAVQLYRSLDIISEHVDDDTRLKFQKARDAVMDIACRMKQTDVQQLIQRGQKIVDRINGKPENKPRKAITGVC